MKLLFGYSMTRNAFCMYNLPDKYVPYGTITHYNSYMDRILSYPVAVTITIFTLPMKIRNDLVRMEYNVRNLPLPSSLVMNQISDVIFT